MSDPTPTAEITASALHTAAVAAGAYHRRQLDKMRTEYIARVSATRHGPPWNRRNYTVAEAEQRWPSDHSQIGAYMDDYVFRPPNGSGWYHDRWERAVALIKLATTDCLHDIRIPQRDALFLRPFLNGETVDA